MIIKMCCCNFDDLSIDSNFSRGTIGWPTQNDFGLNFLIFSQSAIQSPVQIYLHSSRLAQMTNSAPARSPMLKIGNQTKIIDRKKYDTIILCLVINYGKLLN